MTQSQQAAFGTFGYFDFAQLPAGQFSQPELAGFIKVVLVRAGGRVVIDFNEYRPAQDALFFINVGQYYWFDRDCTGTVLYYHRDFYCIQIHDKEVACDGILFHNAYHVPVVFMNDAARATMRAIVQEVRAEMALQDSGMEEMLRILLKQLIIRATRFWKQQHHVVSEEARQEVEFSRTFSQLVEGHYTRQHAVADYAAMLHITPKVLNKRITRYSNSTPNDVIKNRIILEAKRLLIHTQLSVKEIGYLLGYDDPSYFIRLFTKQVATPPQTFRLHYQHGATA